ncbi:hypothetical protein C1H46_032685 [Malus baccata]|uniref:26S proteasome complex subunit SEM1 n=1 Tax=Malus baccata TaxID=106549 RepID=A0A540L5J1_MALBA|nr:hypothetical protein C1H46_032685 [Malus baccata]
MTSFLPSLLILVAVFMVAEWVRRSKGIDSTQQQWKDDWDDDDVNDDFSMQLKTELGSNAEKS